MLPRAPAAGGCVTGPNQTFAAPVMMSSSPMNITDFNVNPSILEDILQGIEIKPLLEQIPAEMSAVDSYDEVDDELGMMS